MTAVIETTVTEAPVAAPVATRHRWTTEERETIQAELDAAPRGQQGPILAHYAAKFNVQPSTVYQMTRGHKKVAKNPIERLVNERESLVTKASDARTKAVELVETAKAKAAALKDAAKAGDARIKSIDAELKAFAAQLEAVVGS
jgi:hypothetical protein